MTTSDATGYVFNIKMLRRVFAPTFQLHDIKQTAQNELTTRWTMSMQFTFNKYNPLRKYWDPQLLFTGTSIMGVNPDTGDFPQAVLSQSCLVYDQADAMLHTFSPNFLWHCCQRRDLLH